jgi:hypothetical protein
MRERAFFLVPGTLGACLEGLSAQKLPLMPHELYCAQVLGDIYAALIQEFDPARTLLLDHAELPGARRHRNTAASPHALAGLARGSRKNVRARRTAWQATPRSL